MTWWHGGTRIKGDWVLPPNQTGVPGAGKILAGTPFEEEVARVYDPDRVYIIDSRAGAVMFACVHAVPWIFEVEPEGELLVDPDFKGDKWQSRSCEYALIVRRYNPPKAQVLRYRQVLMAERR